MAYSVSDIIGKGFKFDQQIEVEKINQIITGTIGVFVGGANWGPIGAPTFVQNTFAGSFGTPLIRTDGADFSGKAADYFLGNSPYLWFTRVADGTQRQSRLALTKAAQPAKLNGNAVIKDSRHIITTGDNDKLSIGVNTGSGFTDEVITLSQTPSCADVVSSANTTDITSNIPADLAYNFSIGSDYINFIIDEVEYRYVVKEETCTDLDAPDFLRLVVQDSGTAVDSLGYGLSYYGLSTDWNTYTPDTSVDSYVKRLAYALKKYVVVPTLMTARNLTISAAQIEADLIVTVAGNTIVLNSTKIGAESQIINYNFPKVYTSASPANPIVSFSANTTIATIIGEINTVLDPDALVWIDSVTGYLAIGSAATGANKQLRINTIANDFYTELGLTAGATVYSGSDSVSDGGTFLATYTGKSGDDIMIRNIQGENGDTLEIYFQNILVGSFFNFSYTVADPTYIGSLINANTDVAKVLTFTTPALAEIPAFSYGDTYLSGGSSGVANLADLDYMSALEEYKNIDLYQIDLIGVPGIVSTAVIGKLKEVCEYRKDCFSVIDMPENKSGLPAFGGNIYSAIAYHNAVSGSGNTVKFNSMYLSTYFPWLSINDVDGINWYSPSVRVMGAIAQSDKKAGNKYAAPAGPNRATITDIEGLAIYLREDEKNKLYADELGNSINPIVFDKARGFYIDGQKNTDRTFGAISRLNVLRTALTIKKRVYGIAPDFFWQPLTVSVMDEFKEVLSQMMEELVAAQAIKKDYTVACDTSINTPLIEAQRGLIATITWTPVRSIEKIKIVSVLKDMQINVVIG